MANSHPPFSQKEKSIQIFLAGYRNFNIFFARSLLMNSKSAPLNPWTNYKAIYVYLYTAARLYSQADERVCEDYDFFYLSRGNVATMQPMLSSLPSCIGPAARWTLQTCYFAFQNAFRAREHFQHRHPVYSFPFSSWIPFAKCFCLRVM